MDVEEALLRLKTEPYDDLGYAKLDHHRGLRQGIAEVIYGSGQDAQEQIAGISENLLAHGQKTILITRMGEEAAQLLAKRQPSFVYHSMGRVGIVGEMPKPDGIGKVVVATGGTSDMPSPRRPPSPPRPSATRWCAYTMWASPACTGCSRTWRRS